MLNHNTCNIRALARAPTTRKKNRPRHPILYLLNSKRCSILVPGFYKFIDTLKLTFTSNERTRAGRVVANVKKFCDVIITC